MTEEDRYTSCAVEDDQNLTLTKKKWKQQRPNSDQSDILHELNRPEQVILCRMTRHNRLNFYCLQCTASSKLVSLRCAPATKTS